MLCSFGQNGCQKSSDSSKLGDRNSDFKDIGEFLHSRTTCCTLFALVMISKLLIAASSEILKIKDGGCIFGRVMFIMKAICCGRLSFVACGTPCGVGENVLFPCGIGKRWWMCEFVCNKIIFITSCSM